MHTSLAQLWKNNYFPAIRQKSTELKKPFAILFIIYVIALIPLLRANFNYIDDLGRVKSGTAGWENYSRYVSNFLSKLIHAGNYLTDISPLTQLIAIAFLALAGAIVYITIVDNHTKNLGGVLACIPLGLSPYFLECISYKYDSPYMALSVLASIFPVLLLNSGWLVYSLIIIACTLIVCMTYQAASGIFPMLVILLCMKKWNQRESYKRISCFVGFSAISYLVALLIFKCFIMQPAETHVSNSLPPVSMIIPTAITHLKKYYTLISTDFRSSWLVLILVLELGFIYTLVRDSMQNKIIAVIVHASGLILLNALMFGMYPILTAPSFSARAMYGFGAFITFIMIIVVSSAKVYWAKLSGVILCWCFVVFASTYGNALAVQNNYTDFRINAVIMDLNDLDQFNTDEVKNIQISGTIGFSPVLYGTIKHYPILNRLIPINFREDWYWGTYSFFNYYNLKNANKNTSVDFTTIDLPLLKETMYHTIRGEDNNILIELK